MTQGFIPRAVRRTDNKWLLDEYIKYIEAARRITITWSESFYILFNRQLREYDTINQKAK